MNRRTQQAGGSPQATEADEAPDQYHQIINKTKPRHDVWDEIDGRDEVEDCEEHHEPRLELLAGERR